MSAHPHFFLKPFYIRISWCSWQTSGLQMKEPHTRQVRWPAQVKDMAAGVLTFSSKSSGPEQDHVTSSFLMQIIIHDSLCLVAQLCPTLCNPTDCSLPGSSVHGDSPAKNTGVGCHTLLQGIFPTQGSNPGLTHCRWTLYHLSHQGSLC